MISIRYYGMTLSHEDGGRRPSGELDGQAYVTRCSTTVDRCQGLAMRTVDRRAISANVACAERTEARGTIQFGQKRSVQWALVMHSRVQKLSAGVSRMSYRLPCPGGSWRPLGLAVILKRKKRRVVTDPRPVTCAQLGGGREVSYGGNYEGSGE